MTGIDTSRPVISVDAVVLRASPSGAPQVLTYTRQWDPYLGEVAIPGVMMVSGESVIDASRRAVTDKTGLSVPSVGNIALGYRDAALRDGRGHTISLPTLWTVQADSPTLEGASWRDVGDLPRLAFDHDEIVASALEVVSERVFSDAEMVRSLFGDTVSSRRLGALVRAVNPCYRMSNLSRDLAGGVYSSTGKVESSGRGRPSTLWHIG